MTAEKTPMTFGRRVYGLGVVAMGVVCLVWGDFFQGQPVPKGFPARTALAYAIGAFLVVAGAAVDGSETSLSVSGNRGSGKIKILEDPGLKE